jgi:DNA-binding MarR family transcriptional regulator
VTVSERRPTRSTGELVGAAPEEGRELIRAFLSEQEERAWTGLVDTHEALVRELDARLLAEHNMPLSTFEALMQIAHAGGGTITISALAERVRLSPSHVSRLVIDLERRGFVERQRSTADSRSTRAAITEAGRKQLQEAGGTYLSTIRALLLDPLSEREVKQLVRTWERIGTPRVPASRQGKRRRRGSDPP